MRQMPAGVRTDAVMYCLDAFGRFSKLTPEQVERIGFEIALLGRQGLDMSGFDRKYTLKNLSGQFSGTHLVCLMYVAFRQVVPDQPIGFDLSREYEVAKGMMKKEGG